jgi:hypothetical protein
MNIDLPGEWHRGPFGTPDASRAGAQDDYFPVVGASPALVGANKLRERVIIGKKGAGKTIYLRALLDALPKLGESSVDPSGENWFVFREVFNLETLEVLGVSRLAKQLQASLLRSSDIYINPKAQSREVWTRVWHNAVVAALYILVFSPGAQGRFREVAERLLEHARWRQANEGIRTFLKSLPRTPSPVLMIRYFHSQARGKFNRLRPFLDDPRWDEAYLLVCEASRFLPPIALFVDAIDDDFDAAPEAWLECQEGLFRCIFKILNRADSFSNRVHIIVALRDIVYSSLLNSEHASRYLTDSHIRYLAWDAAAARTFLVEKIRRLSPSDVARPDLDVERYPIARWLGFDRLNNPKRGSDETVLDYVLRHTRLLPRDIVILGNAVCNEQQLRSKRGEVFGEAKLRQVVSDVARSTTREALTSCINEHLLSMDYVAEALLHTPPPDFNADGGAENPDDGVRRVLPFEREIRGALESRVAHALVQVGKEKFSRAELIAALSKHGLIAEEELGVRGRASFFRFDNIFWRHGLIAFQSNDGGTFRWRFHWRGTPDRQELPEDAPLYGFHPGLIDVFPSIRSMGHDPVF